MNSLLGKVGSCGKNNSSNVLQKQGTLTPARAFSPFSLNCLSTSVEKVPSIVSAVDAYVNK